MILTDDNFFCGIDDYFIILRFKFYREMKIGFDNEKYLRIQSEHIKERIAHFGNKLYLELGGKLFDDHHASRVLPGFEPDSKLRMFKQISDRLEIVIVISAKDIEKNKIRNDLGITYDMDVLRLRDEFQKRGFLVSSVVITHYNGQSSADAFRAVFLYSISGECIKGGYQFDGVCKKVVAGWSGGVGGDSHFASSFSS